MKCDHTFKPCQTPVTEGHKWYRCDHCLVFAWKQSRMYKIYKCRHRGCTRPATDRLPGRGPRMSIQWRCGEHGVQETESETSAAAHAKRA